MRFERPPWRTHSTGREPLDAMDAMVFVIANTTRRRMRDLIALTSVWGMESRAIAREHARRQNVRSAFLVFSQMAPVRVMMNAAKVS